jgi:hypothetical protein
MVHETPGGEGGGNAGGPGAPRRRGVMYRAACGKWIRGRAGRGMMSRGPLEGGGGAPAVQHLADGVPLVRAGGGVPLELGDAVPLAPPDAGQPFAPAVVRVPGMAMFL